MRGERHPSDAAPHRQEQDTHAYVGRAPAYATQRCPAPPHPTTMTQVPAAYYPGLPPAKRAAATTPPISLVTSKVTPLPDRQCPYKQRTENNAQRTANHGSCLNTGNVSSLARRGLNRVLRRLLLGTSHLGSCRNSRAGSSWSPGTSIHNRLLLSTLSGTGRDQLQPGP